MADPAFLLDANICIYLLAGISAEARRRVEACRPGEVVTSAIAYAEVMRKVPASDPVKVAQAEAIFSIVGVLSFDAAAARSYASIPFKRGTFDRLIAAHAMALDLTLVTNNEQDFADVPALKLENWTLP
mgnify:CR=1 FL=1